jgi:hypothetical protein
MTVIEGIALKPTKDVGGTDWTEGALREAADSLADSPVVEEFGPDPDTIGEVTDSEYRDGEGVWYRAEIERDIPFDAVTMAPAVTFGAPVEAEDGNLGVEGITFESMAPVPEATEAVGDHKVVESEDSTASQQSDDVGEVVDDGSE